MVTRTKETVVWQMKDRSGAVVSERVQHRRTVYRYADGSMKVNRPGFSDKQPIVLDASGRLVSHDGVYMGVAKLPSFVTKKEPN